MKYTVSNWDEVNAIICEQLGWVEVDNNYVPSDYVNYPSKWLIQHDFHSLGYDIPQFTHKWDDMGLLIKESNKNNIEYNLESTFLDSSCELYLPSVNCIYVNSDNENLPNSLPLMVVIAYLKFMNIKLEGELKYMNTNINLTEIFN